MLKWIKNPKVCVIFGVPLHLHFTFIAFFIGLSVMYPASILATALIFASVVAHEYGHILAARYCGIGCKRVILLPVGGVALLERMPQEPTKELIITAAGPLVSLVLALWGGALALLTFKITEVFAIFALGNLALFLFNVLPAFPMDGGRIFRACLHYWLSYEQSTLIAVRTGQYLACFIGLVGILSLQIMLPITMLLIILLGQAELTHVRNAKKKVYP